MVEAPDAWNRKNAWVFLLGGVTGLIMVGFVLAGATRKPTQPSPTPVAQSECAPCDVSPPIGSLLQHIEMISDNGQDWYVFRCAGWQYRSISRSVQELLITFDPAQKEPSPRCWISKPQTEQRITALHLEFASLTQFKNMLVFSPAPQH